MIRTRFITFLLSAVFLSLPILATAEDRPLASGMWDPLEGVNRKTFWFNEQTDWLVLEPLSEGYKAVTNKPVRTGIGNFFENLSYPKYAVSDIVQFKFTQLLKHTGRFLINTTIGVLGFIDFAEDIGLPKHEEDFGTALGYHGVPPGPYIVIPVLGPSNVRDFSGKVVDFFLDPFYIVQKMGMPHPEEDIVSVSSIVLRAADTRTSLDEAIKTGRESSVDYYLFQQSAYGQYRQGVIYDGMPPDDEE